MCQSLSCAPSTWRDRASPLLTQPALLISPPRIGLIQNNTHTNLALYFLSMASHSDNLDAQPSLSDPAVPLLPPQEPCLAQVPSEAVTLRRFSPAPIAVSRDTSASSYLDIYQGFVSKSCNLVTSPSHPGFIESSHPIHKQLISPCSSPLHPHPHTTRQSLALSLLQ